MVQRDPACDLGSRASASQRCQLTRLSHRRSRNASATARVDRPRLRAWSRMRCTAIACTGGCVIPEVCRLRGALAASADVAHRAGPGKYPSTPFAKTMCGIMPLAHWAESSVSSSTTARSTLSGANPIATKAASQLHICGYSSGAAVVIVPRSLPRNRYAARAASCVGAKLGSWGIASMMRRPGKSCRSVG